MISQEIKLHDEPVAYTPPPVQQHNHYMMYPKKSFTQWEISKEHNKAITAQIKIGSKFRYKTSGATIEVLSFNLDPKHCEDVDGEPAIIYGRRVASGFTPDAASDYCFNYSVAELLDPHLEKVE
jgi:hypothetical protein